MIFDLIRVMKEEASHMGRMVQGLQRGTMTMDLLTDTKRATAAITGIPLTLPITNHQVAGKVDTVKLRPPMVSSMGNPTTAKVPHARTHENTIITQGEYRGSKHHRVGEVSSIGIRRDIICNHRAKRAFRRGKRPYQEILLTLNDSPNDHKNIHNFYDVT